MINKKGSSVIWAFFLIFAALMVSIFLGLAVFGFGLVNDVLSLDVDIGQVNLKEASDSTFGQINTGLVDNADTIGTILLLGMCLLMILNGYFIGSNNPKIFFVVDVFLLALFFIPSIYVSQMYDLFIHSTTLFEGTYINTIPKVSKFMLNLPSIIATTGVITMIVSYIGIKKDDTQRGDGANVLGY